MKGCLRSALYSREFDNLGEKLGEYYLIEKSASYGFSKEH